MLARILKILNKPSKVLPASRIWLRHHEFVATISKVEVVVSVIYCCVTHHSKLSSLKNKSFLSWFCRIKIKIFFGFHQARWAEVGIIRGCVMTRFDTRVGGSSLSPRKVLRMTSWASLLRGRIRRVRLPTLLLAYPRVSVLRSLCGTGPARLLRVQLQMLLTAT